MPENAIYRLAAAVSKVGAYEFPVTFTPTTRAFFAGMSKILGGQTGAAMTALLANPEDGAANAIVSRDPTFHSMLRTTCVATLLDAGHANNALPQRARANINCRIIPGATKASVEADLARAINDPKVSITPEATNRPVAIEPPLDPRIVEPAQTLAAKYFPGVPMLPVMSTGATDAIFLTGIPTYGVPGVFGDMDGNGAHGLNERIRVKSVYEGRDYLYDLVKIYAGGK